MVDSTSLLNPEAPEFFPSYLYYPPRNQNTHFFYAFANNSQLFSSRDFDPSSCIYYAALPSSSSPFICYPNKNETLISPAAVDDRSSAIIVSEQTHLVQEQRQQQLGPPREGGDGGGRGYHQRNNRRGQKGYDCHNHKRSSNHHHAGGNPCPKRNYPILPITSDEQDTTVMIRNIPNRYSRDLLMEFLDNHCMQENEKAKANNENIISAFDFLYLPIDFHKKANKGYAFVNFTDPKAAWKFHLAVHNKRWDLFQSTKICEIVSARIQGKQELIRHFESSVFECKRDDYLPVSYNPPRDGSKVRVKETIVGNKI